MNRTTMLIALLAVLIMGANRGYAEQPPSPCHPNPNADQDMAAVAERGDIASLPAPLESQILRIAGRPHSQLPTQAFNEADGASQLFQYYLLDANGFEPNVFTRFADMAQEAATSRVVAGVAFPSDVFSGLDLGQSVGRAVIAYAQSDGSGQPFTGSYPPTPGVWSSNAPVTPLAGTWKPWVLASAQDFRPGPPPVFGSDAANSQYAAVKNLNRTNTTNQLAWFWQPGFFQPLLLQVDLEIFQNHLDQNAPRAARAYAYETIAQHDATLACWDTKYTYLELRPSQADPTISTLFANPQHPGYPSGHACASGSSAAVMSALFPNDASLFTALASGAGTSTFDAGIHTPLDVSEGLKLGTQVGQKIADRASADGAN